MRRPAFRSFNQAQLVAQILERMTGDHCTVEEYGLGRFYVLRDIGGNWEMV